MRQRMKRPTLKLKKETVRILDRRMLSAQELGQVMGGGACKPLYTRRCDCP